MLGPNPPCHRESPATSLGEKGRGEERKKIKKGGESEK